MVNRHLSPWLTALVCLCFSHPLAADDHADQYIYVETYKDLAVKEMLRSGIPASITLAQALLESGAGKSRLATQSRNHFGIKCHGPEWHGGTFDHIDDDRDEHGNLVPSCFRSYPSVEDSYIDHSNYLMNKPRYSKLFNYARTDYVRWAKGLQECGYATDPSYADRLIRIIETMGLYRHDFSLTPVQMVAFKPPFNPKDEDPFQSVPQKPQRGERKMWPAPEGRSSWGEEHN
jgi:flagellum-specific peptidoglycan hydrolase FlgJ